MKKFQCVSQTVESYKGKVLARVYFSIKKRRAYTGNGRESSKGWFLSVVFILSEVATPDH
jgi:hypothetical protein